jgi:methionyl-tRNA formyltransferase
MQMDVGIDTGPILAQRETAIHNGETTGELEERQRNWVQVQLDILPDICVANAATPPTQKA